MSDQAKVYLHKDPIFGDHLGVICISPTGERLKVLLGDGVVGKFEVHEGDEVPYTFKEGTLILELSKKK